MNQSGSYAHKGEPFERDMTYLPDRILAGEESADPLDDAFPSGSKDSPRDASTWEAAPGRYRLVAARACPWAHRSIIVNNSSSNDASNTLRCRRSGNGTSLPVA